MAKKFILFVFSILIFVGCDMAMEQLGVTNGSKYIVTSKKKRVGVYHYSYLLIKEGGDKFYQYYYEDTTTFNVGDTLVLSIKKVK